VEAHGKYWEPFAFQCAWQAPLEDEPRSRVYRAHFRNIYECVYQLGLPYGSSCIRPLQIILFTKDCGGISTLARVRVIGNLCFMEAQSACTFMRAISMASSPTTVKKLRLPHRRESKGKSNESMKELPPPPPSRDHPSPPLVERDDEGTPQPLHTCHCASLQPIRLPTLLFITVNATEWACHGEFLLHACFHISEFQNDFQCMHHSGTNVATSTSHCDSAQVLSE
jgi:hypothetical protein